MASSGGEATGEKRSRFRDHWLLGRKIVELSDSWPPAYAGAQQQSVLARVNSSITWHTWAHRQATRWYSGLTALQITASAAIPVLTVAGGTSFSTRVWVASLGAFVVVVEGILQLKKYGQNALLWGQGKEALKREYFLYQAQVRPYDQPATRDKVLARRVELIIGAEVGRWAGTVPAPAERGGDG